MNSPRVLASCAVFMASHGLVACADPTADPTGVPTDSEPAVLTTIVVTPVSATLDALGDTLTINAIARDQHGAVIPDVVLVWRSSNDAVATVDRTNGLATATGNGSAELTVSSAGVSAVASVEVDQVATSITLSPEVGAGFPGQSLQFVAVAVDKNGHSLPADRIDWLISATGTGSVTSTGLVSMPPEARPGVGFMVFASSGSVADTGGVLVRYPSGLVSAGSRHTCRVSAVGLLTCWGRNFRGALGDGTTNDHPSPVRVTGGGEYFTVSTGHDFTCAINLEGRLLCWGDNGSGRLGVGDRIDRLVPTPVDSERRFRALAAGHSHACAVAITGQAICWGGSGGKLGTGSLGGSDSPVPVLSDDRFEAVGAGNFHSCALANTSRVLCWGSNNRGQVGDGSTTDRDRPTVVFGGASYSRLAVGDAHACAIRTDKAAFCWGFNTDGRLGDGTTTDRSTPTLAMAGVSFDDIVAGRGHSCGLVSNPRLGNVACWGDNSVFQASDGDPYSYVVISAGGLHTCGIATSGRTYCWGWNVDGALGRGTFIGKSSDPLLVPD